MTPAVTGRDRPSRKPTSSPSSPATDAEPGGVGQPVRHGFVWRREGGRWTTILREFSWEKDISALGRIMQAAAAEAAAAPAVGPRS